MLNVYSERLSVNLEDPWALSIQWRIYQCIDFVAAEARYHQGCKDDLEVYDKRYVKMLLQRHYERHITFSEETGKPSLIILQEMAKCLIKEKYAETKTNTDNEKLQIIMIATNLVKAEIREKHYSMDVYPNSTQIKQLDWIQKSLKLFMQQFTSSSIKQESIRQSIIKAACQRNVILPLLFGLGTVLDHMFGSR